jgi:hypothetical protein
VGPTLNVKTPNIATVCTGTNVKATFTAGTGGVGCGDSYQYSTDNGTTWNAYTGGTDISTTGSTGVIIQGKRNNCDAYTGCTGTSFVTLASWAVVAQPVGPTLLLKTPNVASLCPGNFGKSNIHCRHWWSWFVVIHISTALIMERHGMHIQEVQISVQQDQPE